MKYHILYNPLSANGNGKEKAEILKKEYAGAVFDNITKLNDYKAFFASLDPEDKIIICGGDGTINHFVNNTDGIDISNEILYYACGTGNDFLHDIGKSADKPFRLNEYIEDLPVVEVNGKKSRFINNVGFGIDGYCCEVGDAQKEKSDKPVNYTAIAIKGLLFGYKPTSAVVTVDGVEHHYKKVWIAPTMKGRYYGGGMIATPEQDRGNKDGKLSVMLFYGKGKLKTLSVFPSIFKGEHVKHTDMVVIHTGYDISVKFDSPSPLQIDGETVSGVTSYHAYTSAKNKCADSEKVLAEQR